LLRRLATPLPAMQQCESIAEKTRQREPAGFESVDNQTNPASHGQQRQQFNGFAKLSWLPD
jgi:hypothetical protein